MAQEESGNHEAAAFDGDLPASSQNTVEGPRRWAEPWCVAWALGLLLWVLLHATLLADTTAFVRVAAIFDRPPLAWLEAACGYAGIIGVTVLLQQQSTSSTRAAATLAYSILVFASYGYHLFLLRWPWLTGSAAADSRLTLWSGVLSATWHGVPWLAFGELLGVAIILTHSLVGLSLTSAWKKVAGAEERRRIILMALGLFTYSLASSVVVALATGRR